MKYLTVVLSRDNNDNVVVTTFGEEGMINHYKVLNDVYRSVVSETTDIHYWYGFAVKEAESVGRTLKGLIFLDQGRVLHVKRY